MNVIGDNSDSREETLSTRKNCVQATS